MVKVSRLELVATAINEGGITFDQCKIIAQTLPCFDSFKKEIAPGTSKTRVGRTILDLSPCTEARIKAGEPPLDHDITMTMQRFPNKNSLAIPIYCANCKVFAPALKKLHEVSLKA